MWRRRGGHREYLAEAHPAVAAAGRRHRGGHRRGADPHRGRHRPGTEAAPVTRQELADAVAETPRIHATQRPIPTIPPPADAHAHTPPPPATRPPINAPSPA